MGLQLGFARRPTHYSEIVLAAAGQLQNSLLVCESDFGGRFYDEMVYPVLGQEVAGREEVH